MIHRIINAEEDKEGEGKKLIVLLKYSSIQRNPGNVAFWTSITQGIGRPVFGA